MEQGSGSGELAGAYPPAPPGCAGAPRMPPPPAQPGQVKLQVITQTFVVEGSVESFDADGFKSSLAVALDISADLIELAISAGSVQVVSTIRTTSAALSTAVTEQLADFASDPDAASVALNILVVSASTPEVSTSFVVAPPPSPPPPPLTPPPLAPSSLNATETGPPVQNETPTELVVGIAAACIGGLLVVCLVLACCFSSLKRCTQRGPGRGGGALVSMAAKKKRKKKGLTSCTISSERGGSAQMARMDDDMVELNLN